VHPEADGRRRASRRPDVEDPGTQARFIDFRPETRASPSLPSRGILARISRAGHDPVAYRSRPFELPFQAGVGAILRNRNIANHAFDAHAPSPRPSPVEIKEENFPPALVGRRGEGVSASDRHRVGASSPFPTRGAEARGSPQIHGSDRSGGDGTASKNRGKLSPEDAAFRIPSRRVPADQGAKIGTLMS
jgi:hypothetical protein